MSDPATVVSSTGRRVSTTNVTITQNSAGQTLKIVEEYPGQTVITNYTYLVDNG